MTPKPDLSSYMVGEATPEEMARQWAAIEPRLARGPRRSRRVALSLVSAGAAAAALTLFFAYRPAVRRAWTSHGEPMTVALGDGSRLELRPASDVRLVREQRDEICLQLLRGAAHFEVRPNASRRFQVKAADVDVLVTGTIFTVELQAGQRAPRVSVERGEVEVHGRGGGRLLARLRAGESWPPRPAPSPSPAGEPAASAPGVATGPLPAGGARALPAPGQSSPGGTRREPAMDSRQLLEQANVARRSGDLALAASLFETLRTRYPRDPRAALATFELGRLRMDSLGDLPGAVKALKHAIALAPSGVFREDADACLATAYARMHDRTRCERARRSYLERYPEGMHAAAMSALDCRGP